MKITLKFWFSCLGKHQCHSVVIKQQFRTMNASTISSSASSVVTSFITSDDHQPIRLKKHQSSFPSSRGATPPVQALLWQSFICCRNSFKHQVLVASPLVQASSAHGHEPTLPKKHQSTCPSSRGALGMWPHNANPGPTRSSPLPDEDRTYVCVCKCRGIMAHLPNIIHDSYAHW